MAVAIAWLAHVAVAADLPPAAVLDLPGDGFLAGRLAERAPGAAPRATLPWRSPLFAEPIEFHVDAITRVRFPGPFPPPADAPWRCDLEGGDVLVGAIAGLDPEHLAFRPADVGAETLRIRRTAVVRLTRIASGASVIVPGGLERWRTIAGAWTAPGGLPTAREKGATAYRPLEAPRRACYDIALSWTKRPEFEVSVAAAEPPRPGGRAPPADRYRLESVEGTLLAIREGDRAAAEPIAELAAGDRGIRALLFVDRDRGRMAVILSGREGAAEKVFDVTVPPRGDGAGGILVKLGTGDLRIDGLEVTEWREPEPQVATAPPPRAASYDAATGEFAVDEAGATRRLAATAATVLTVRGADEAGTAAPAADAVRASFHGGSRLSGRLLAIDGGAVVLAAPALADELACPFGRLAMLEPVAPRDPPGGRGRTAILDGAHGRLAGTPASPPGGAGFGWLARGAVAAVAIPAGVEPLWIAYPETQGKGPADAAYPAVVHLRNGDAFACAVLDGDAEGLRVRTAVAAVVPVPAATLRAVELVPSESLGVPREKLARLLTLPRMQEADPPTHMLRLQTGDYVRGKLVSLDATTIRFDVLGTVKTFPRDAAGRLIWLRRRGDPSPEAVAQAAAGLPVRGLARDGQRLTVEALKVVGSQLVGRHPVLGEAGIDLATCDRLLVAAAIAATPPESLPFTQWVLVPAAVPRAVEAAGGPVAGAGAKPDQPSARAAAVAAATPAEAAALAAAEQAAFAGDRGCLEPLGALLFAEAPDVRRRASGLLRQVTGRPTRELPFRADDPAERRQADAVRWRQWIAREGLFADLVVPRRPDAVAAGKPLGRTLCSIPGENAVVEIDGQGRETFRAEAREAYACELLPDGSRLVADGRSLVEYDAAGREAWSLPNLPRVPMSVRRLDDGHTLVAFDGFDKGQVVEYDRSGERVWGWNAGHGQMPADAVRLSDGGTLVALHGANRVIEVDESGAETWGIDVDDPLRVERLADGTTLVVSGDSKRGWIYDREGGVVRDLGEVQDARVGAGGVLLLDLNGGFVEQRPDGRPLQGHNLPAGTARFQRR